MPGLNPYAPPTSDDAPRVPDDAGDSNVFRQGDVAMVPAHGALMPDRCVVCNAPAGGFKLRRTLYWHHPAIYLLLLAGAMLYVIASLIVRKRATITFGICEAHRARRRWAIALAVGGGILGFVLMFSGATSTSSLPLMVGIFMVLVLPITGALLARTIYPSRIDDRWAWLKVGRPFLESLPPG